MSVVRDAGVGAAVTVALSFLPFSSVAGGAVTAHRDGGGYRRAVWLGALSGLFAAVPLLVLFVPALWIAGLLGFGIAPGAPGYDLFLAIVFALFGVYTVGLSALGGPCGVWLRRHSDRTLDPAAWL